MATTIHGLRVTTLFDSGATHSAVNSIIGRRLIESGIRVLPSGLNICDVQGNALNVLGKITVPIIINANTVTWTIQIIDKLAEPCIIGAYFMTKQKISINFGTQQVYFNDEMLESLSTKVIKPVHRTFIPENHHVKFRCNISCPDNVILTPGSLVITKRNEIVEGVFMEEAITKVMRNNMIFVVVTNMNPYSVFLKPTQSVGEVTDTSTIKVLPVSEAQVSSFGISDKTGKILPPTSEKLQYLKDNFNCPLDTSPEIRAQYEDLILQNHDVFAKDKYDLGFSDRVSHKINMKTAQPVYVKQFRIPDAYEEVILNHVEEWKKQSVIEECCSPYNSPVFCVPKKDGGLRIVQDLRQINKASYEDKYAIKDVQQCVDVIGKSNSRIFSTMDMASGFWQQDLEEGSRDYTAFTIPILNTQFRWKRNVMGLQGAPASFSRLTALVFRGIDKAITYIDDLLTHSQTHEEQLNILQLCFDRMRSFTMKFNIKKCVFGATSVTYLGFQISETGISPANDKVIAVRNFNAPRTMKEVRAFVGFCNYFRRMVPNFSRLAGPLIAMTKLSSGWKSGDLPPDAMQSFINMKQALSSGPVVGYSRPGGQYILTVDAATTGLGAILTQATATEEVVISYWSRTLRDHERNYTPYMLEMTAVCSALEHFHENVFGRKVIVYTDHRPLLGASTIQKKTINRLVEQMNIYNIDLRYKKGLENQGADYLSRNAVLAISNHDRYEDIRVHQRSDDLVVAITGFLEHNVLPVSNDLQKMVLNYGPRCFMKQDLLWIVPPRSPMSKAVLFTPVGMIQTIIQNAHGNPLSGHWAISRTVARISESYFWPTMSKDVTWFIKNCGPCQKAQRPPKNAELTPWPATSQPNERIHIDLFGPLQGDPNYKYVCVITCAFTKWTEVLPLPNKEAPTVAKAVFEEWICRKGVFQQLISDGGKEFANTLLDELCKLMNAKKHVVTAYHPMANGQVERFNRDMRKYLMTMLEDTTDWVAYLKPLQFAHNTAVSKSTHFTPHYLTYLDNPRLPDTISLTHEATHNSSYSADAFRRLQYAYNLVYKNNEEARQAYTKNFNVKAKARHFKAGDEVLASFPVYQHIPNKKLASIWRGPFFIVEVCENNVLILKASNKSKSIKVHVNRVRLFNHLIDKVIEPLPANASNNEDNEDNEVITTPPDDNDDSSDIFDLEPDPVVQEQAPVQVHAQEQQPQAAPELEEQQRPVSPFRIVQQAQNNWVRLGPLDRLAVELFRHTRSRGPVGPIPEASARPLEYKKRK